jgi:hypothetical protein
MIGIIERYEGVTDATKHTLQDRARGVSVEHRNPAMQEERYRTIFSPLVLLLLVMLLLPQPISVGVVLSRHDNTAGALQPQPQPEPQPQRNFGPPVEVLEQKPKQPISVGVILSGNYNTAGALEPQPQPQPEVQRNSGRPVEVSEEKPKNYSISAVEDLPAGDSVISKLSARRFNDEHLSTSDSVTGRQSASAR